MDLQTARTKAAALLGTATQPDHGPALVDLEDGVTGTHPFMERKEPSGFAEPEVLYFGLTQLLDLRGGERGDKVAWTIPFEFRGVHFAFELRKYGLRFMCERSRVSDPIVREVYGRARSLANIATQHLEAVQVPLQLKSGNVTFPNYFAALDRRYRFFREEALASFPAAPIVTPENIRDLDFAPYFAAQDRADDLATACVDAYFSRMDHLLVLSLGFIGDVVERGALMDFLSGNWTTKVLEQLEPGDDPPLKKLYDDLNTLRREWRNPWAHGGFKSKGASFYFHVPRVGALPVTLSSDERRTIDLQATEPDFQHALATFDHCDRLLAEGKLKYAFQWAESGLDLAVDADSRSGLRAAMSSQEAFDAFLDGVGRRQDMLENVDY